jgi:hypothetical protein
MFKLEFSTENAAFEDGATLEIMRILSKIVRQLDQHMPGDDTADIPIYDVNGNRVGAWSLTQPE